MATNCGLLTKEFRDLTTGIEVWAESQKSKSLYNDPFEAAMKMVDTGHWGPWDSNPPR